MDNHVQVLKSVPVNLSLSTEPQEAKREPFSGSSGPGGPAGDGGSPALTAVKAEMYAPVFMAGTGLHYRMEEEEEPASRVAYEQNPYEVTAASHASYVKEDRQSPPDSPYEEERDGVRSDLSSENALDLVLNRFLLPSQQKYRTPSALMADDFLFPQEGM